MEHSTYELTLTTLTYGGEAMGRLPDPLTGAGVRAVFVPFGLPGEKVRVRLTEEKRGFARGELVEILQASAERIQPKCRHFFSLTPSPLPPGEGQGVRGFCGGCHYQHLSYESQLKYKADILRDQLQRIGRIENPPVRQTAASPKAWNYRNHVQFHLTRDGKLGFVNLTHASRSSPERRGENVMAISECHLPESSINELWPQLEFEPGTGIERVSIRAGMDDELMLALESDSPGAPDFEIEAGISVAHVFDEHAVVIAGSDHLTMKILDREFRVSAPSFFQVNTQMAEKMVTYLLNQLPVINSQSIILDVYCGVGLFSAFLAPKCGQLIGVESSESACEDFVINLDEFENVELYEDLAENVLPTLKIKPDIILADPPRTGVEKGALDAIVRMNPKMIAYVSCDPSTLARDAGRLIQNGYKLLDVTPFDLFPQTYHIESISVFENLSR